MSKAKAPATGRTVAKGNTGPKNTATQRAQDKTGRLTGAGSTPPEGGTRDPQAPIRIDPEGPTTASGTAQFPRSGANKPPGTPKAPAPGAENNKPRDLETGRTITGGVRVRATKMGFYDQKRIRVGDVFTIREDKFPKGHDREGQLVEFSRKWMKLVDPNTPEKITPGHKALKALNEEQLATRRAGGGAPAVRSHDPIGDDEDEEEDVTDHGSRV